MGIHDVSVLIRRGARRCTVERAGKRVPGDRAFDRAPARRREGRPELARMHRGGPVRAPSLELLPRGSGAPRQRAAEAASRRSHFHRSVGAQGNRPDPSREVDELQGADRGLRANP